MRIFKHGGVAVVAALLFFASYDVFLQIMKRRLLKKIKRYKIKMSFL